jgi:hypothetical protein
MKHTTQHTESRIISLRDFSRGRSVRSRGFTLLLAALVSSIVLALGASIFVLTKKQVTLSSLGRDSQYAFYAADQGAECALYWDSRRNYFATSTPPGFDVLTLKCDGQCLKTVSGPCLEVDGRPPPPIPDPNNYSYTMTFSYEPRSGTAGYCSEVSVSKVAVAGVVNTTVHANGFNTTCGTRDTNPRTLQRSIELSY